MNGHVVLVDIQNKVVQNGAYIKGKLEGRVLCTYEDGPQEVIFYENGEEKEDAEENMTMTSLLGSIEKPFVGLENKNHQKGGVG